MNIPRSIQKKILPFIVVFCIGWVTGNLLPFPYNALPEKDTRAITPTGTVKSEHTVSQESIATVSAVVDGDTIKLTTGETVRYIGVDTPETKHPQKGKECFGAEASQFNTTLVEGKTVRLVKDVSNTDRYSRLLRYVYVLPAQNGDQEVFVNAELVQNGYAVASSYPPDVAMDELFSQMETEARNENRGLWGSCSL